MKVAQQLLTCSLILLPSVNASASADKKDYFTFGVSADYESTDNAKRSPDPAEAIDEIQNVYIVDVGAQYENEWSQLISQYDIRREIFQSESQPDATEIRGNTRLTFGNDYQPFNLSIIHNRDAVLVSPEAVDLAINRDTQELITVEPSVKLHISSADYFTAVGSYTDVSYKEDEQKKSERKGLRAGWVHGISKTDKIQVIAQRTDISFKYVPMADYELENIGAQYEVALKHLNYLIQIGQNKASPKSGAKDVSNPSFRIEAKYQTGANQVALIGSQAITDSSFGSGGQSHVIGAETPIGSGSKGVGLDLINMRTIEVSWETSAICDRCNFGLNAAQTKQDYLNLSEDGGEKTLASYFKYNFTRTASINFSFAHKDHYFSANVDRSGFKSNSAKIGLNYIVVEDLNVELYAQQEKRTSESATQNYEENIIGLRLSYHF